MPLAELQAMTVSELRKWAEQELNVFLDINETSEAALLGRLLRLAC